MEHKHINIFYNYSGMQNWFDAPIELYPNEIHVFKLNNTYDVHTVLDGGYYTWKDTDNCVHKIESVIETTGIQVKGTSIISDKKVTNLYWRWFDNECGEYKTIPYGTLNPENTTKVILRKEIDTNNKVKYFYFDGDNKIYFDTPVNTKLAIDINADEETVNNATKIPIVKRKYIMHITEDLIAEVAEQLAK